MEGKERMEGEKGMEEEWRKGRESWTQELSKMTPRHAINLDCI